LIRTSGGKKSVPDNAVIAYEDDYGKKMFYTRLIRKEWNPQETIGVIRGNEPEVAIFFKGYSEDNPFYYREESHCLDTSKIKTTQKSYAGCQFRSFDITTVLTNPNNCRIGWFKSKKGEAIVPRESEESISFPKAGSTYFARFLAGNVTIPGVISRFVSDTASDPSKDQFKAIAFSRKQLPNEDTETLFIDCDETHLIRTVPDIGNSIKSEIPLCQGKCKLVWRTVNSIVKENIPADAVWIGLGKDDEGREGKLFYTRKPRYLKEKLYSNLGYVNWVDPSTLNFWKGNRVHRVKADDVDILTNPNRCKLDWLSIPASNRETFVNREISTVSDEKSYPKYYNSYFGRSYRLEGDGGFYSPSLLTLDFKSEITGNPLNKKQEILYSYCGKSVHKIHQGVQDNDLGEYDCCPLVWKAMLKTPHGQWIPTQAIQAGIDFYGVTIYYAMIKISLDDGGDTIGFMRADSKIAEFYRGYRKNDKYYLNVNNGCLDKDIQKMKDNHRSDCEYKFTGWSERDLYVLTNPHGCVIDYWKREFDGQIPSSSRERHFPMTGGMRFARFTWKLNQSTAAWSLPDKYEVEETERNCTNWLCKRSSVFSLKKIESNGIWQIVLPGLMKPGHEFFLYSPKAEKDLSTLNEETKFGKGTEVLFIDCLKSLQNLMTVILTDIELEDLETFLTNKTDVSLKSTSIINTTDKTQIPLVMLTSSKESSIKIREFKQNTDAKATIRNTGFDFNVAMKLGITKMKIGAGGAADLNANSEMINKTVELVTSGKTALDYDLKVYTFTQKIIVPPHSNTTISIMTSPVSGTVKFTSKYRMKVPVHGGKEMMTYDGIFNVLKRQGIDILNHKKEGEDFVWTQEGVMSIECGVDTHVAITSVKYQPQWEKDCREDPMQTIYQYNTFPFGKRVVEEKEPDSDYQN
jgi:hypothetical protein